MPRTPAFARGQAAAHTGKSNPHGNRSKGVLETKGEYDRLQVKRADFERGKASQEKKK